MSTWHKYGAKKVEHAGRSFASKLEAAVFQVLCFREKAGEIQAGSILVQQHMPVCGPPGHECSSKCKVELIADFSAVMADGSLRYFEAKGMETSDWRIKRRLWIHNRPESLEIWGNSWQRPSPMETIGGTV